MKATPDVPPALRELVAELEEAAREASVPPPDPPVAWAGDYVADMRRARSERLKEIAQRLEAIAARLEAR